MKKLLSIIFLFTALASVKAQGASYNLPIAWQSSGGSGYVFNIYVSSGSATTFTLNTSVTNTLSATVLNLPLNTTNRLYIVANDKVTGALASLPSAIFTHSVPVPPSPFNITINGPITINLP